MADTDTKDPPGMFGDVQKGLAWFICVSFVLLIFLWALRPPVMAPESMAQLNQLVSTLQNVLLLAIGFYFGSSKSSQNKDDAQAKVTDKLASKVTSNGDGSSPVTTTTTATATPSPTVTTTTTPGTTP